MKMNRRDGKRGLEAHLSKVLEATDRTELKSFRCSVFSCCLANSFRNDLSSSEANNCLFHSRFGADKKSVFERSNCHFVERSRSCELSIHIGPHSAKRCLHLSDRKMIDDLSDDSLCTHCAVAAVAGVVNAFATIHSFDVDIVDGCHDHYDDHRRSCCHSEKQNVSEIDVAAENAGSHLGEGDSFREVVPV